MIILNQSIKTKKKYVCYMDTDSFISYVKAEDFYEDITNDVK